MKKKICLLLAVLALMALPLAASAAEFTLGGQIEFLTIWDSTQVNANLTRFVARNNDPDFQHGRLKFSAERSRLYFLMKGPQIWGAQTTGFIEFDFDNASDVNTAAGALSYSPQKARLGLRHAFFRLSWPQTELVMGHYWSLLTEDIPETGDPGSPLSRAGDPYIREPQIRLTQKCGPWDISLAVSEPSNGSLGTTLDPSQSSVNNNFSGESSETPKLSGRIKYERDLWGTAPYYGKPRGFSARLAAAWQRSRYRSFSATNARTWGENDYQGVSVFQRDQQYLNQWLVEGSLFIPVIASHTPNPSGTLSLMTQWYVGAGVDNFAVDQPANSSFLKWQGIDSLQRNVYDRELMKQYGGFVQGQYWFTEQWYLNAVWGMFKGFGVDRDTDPNAPGGFRFATIDRSSDPVKFNQNYILTLYYRPIQALKFGLEYAYVRADYFQQRNTAGNQNALTKVGQTADIGENHRLLFVGYFFF